MNKPRALFSIPYVCLSRACLGQIILVALQKRTETPFTRRRVLECNEAAVPSAEQHRPGAEQRHLHICRNISLFFNISYICLCPEPVFGFSYKMALQKRPFFAPPPCGSWPASSCDIIAALPPSATSYKENGTFWSFSYVCPEPVLVK